MMTTFVSLYTIQIVLCIFLLSVTLTWLVRKFGIIDQPNPRSSHHKPIARSGGLAIVFSTYVGIVTLLWNYTIFPFSYVILLGVGAAGLILALAGLQDDLGKLKSFKSKFAYQLVSCCTLILCGVVIENFPVPIIGDISLGWWGYPITILWIIGLTNIFNFMDGLDGLAAGTAILVASMFALISFNLGVSLSLVICISLFAATCGFLVFNFPRATIFLGDSGSQFLGIMFASIAVLAGDHDVAVVPILVIPLLFFNFIFDTIFTFCRRLGARENITQAHKTHLYQLLNQIGLSHFQVSSLHFGITLFQGVGAYIMLQLPAAHHWLVFMPFVVIQIIFALVILRCARRRGII